MLTWHSPVLVVQNFHREIIANNFSDDSDNDETKIFYKDQKICEALKFVYSPDYEPGSKHKRGDVVRHDSPDADEVRSENRKNFNLNDSVNFTDLLGTHCICFHVILYIESKLQ